MILHRVTHCRCLTLVVACAFQRKWAHERGTMLGALAALALAAIDRKVSLDLITWLPIEKVTETIKLVDLR